MLMAVFIGYHFHISNVQLQIKIYCYFYTIVNKAEVLEEFFHTLTLYVRLAEYEKKK